jgi:hypothetical protein
VAVHPGVVRTGLGNMMSGGSIFFKAMHDYVALLVMAVSPEEGAKNQLWAAIAEKGEVGSGGYYTLVGVAGGASKNAMDKDLTKWLWDWTER